VEPPPAEGMPVATRSGRPADLPCASATINGSTRERSSMLDGLILYREAAARHKIHLSLLVAETSNWASPDVHLRLTQENGVGTYFPNVRRCRPKTGERKGQILGGERLDDNSYANHAIKQAAGIVRSSIRGFEACHIWPQSCYDSRCHTVIANLVLLPRPLAGLSDHDPEIRTALQFRAFELFNWCPPDQIPPTRPAFFPTTWSSPMPFTERVARALTNRRSMISECK